MFEIKLADVHGPRQMSQAVIQIGQLLGIYQAELARILHINCNDIGDLANARTMLQPHTEQWKQAELLIEFFEKLYVKFDGEAVAMRHWLRADNSFLGSSPLLSMVDDLRILDVIDVIRLPRHSI